MQVVHDEDEWLLQPPGQELELGKGAGRLLVKGRGQGGGKT
jgi:hypothetical protein